MDVRDLIALVGLLMLSGGLYLVYPPASLIIPGAVATWYALIACRATSHTHDHTRPDHEP